MPELRLVCTLKARALFTYRLNFETQVPLEKLKQPLNSEKS